MNQNEIRKIREQLDEIASVVDRLSRKLDWDYDWDAVPEEFKWGVRIGDQAHFFRQRPERGISNRLIWSHPGIDEYDRADQYFIMFSAFQNKVYGAEEETETLRHRPDYVPTVEFVDWDEAPDWVLYAAIDPDGTVWGWEGKPRFSGEYGWTNGGGIYELTEIADLSGIDWTNSLIKRPEVEVDPLEHLWDLVDAHVPSWKYFAIDKNGELWAYYHKPRIRVGEPQWSPRDRGKQVLIGVLDEYFMAKIDWRESLRERG